MTVPGGFFVALRSSSAGAAWRYPQDGSPTLILDFVPTAGTAGITLDLNFVPSFSEYNTSGSLRVDFINGDYISPTPGEPSYSAFSPDPTTGGITNIQVWN